MVGLFFLTAVATFAHHPFDTDYDWKKPVTLTGTVTNVEWATPHVRLSLDAQDDAGARAAWVAELGNPAALGRHGWMQSMLKPGDKLTVDGWMAKDGSKRVSAKSVKLSTGRELFAASDFFDIAAPVATSGVSDADRELPTGNTGTAPKP
jgi:hypothetical protein